MISVNHQFDITGNAIALEVIVPDNARSFSKPLMLVAQQGSRTSSYFSHISYETLKGEGFDILNESGIRKVAGALNLHYMIPLEVKLPYSLIPITLLTIFIPYRVYCLLQMDHCVSWC